MNPLYNMQFNDETNLEKVVFDSGTVSSHGDAHFKYFNFLLNGDSIYKYRIIFKVFYSTKHNLLTFSASTEELVGGYWYSETYSEAIPDTETVCNWVLKDFESIAHQLLVEIKQKLPHARLRFGPSVSLFSDRKLQQIHERQQDKQAV